MTNPEVPPVHAPVADALANTIHVGHSEKLGLEGVDDKRITDPRVVHEAEFIVASQTEIDGPEELASGTVQGAIRNDTVGGQLTGLLEQADHLRNKEQ